MLLNSVKNDISIHCNMIVFYSPDTKYPPLPVDPSTKSFDKSFANSSNVDPITLSPVDVGLPSGASAVYCFNSFGNVFTSLFAIAIDGSSTKIDVMDVADMILLHIQFLRDEESLLIGGIFVDDSALQYVVIANAIDNIKDSIFMLQSVVSKQYKHKTK